MYKLTKTYEPWKIDEDQDMWVAEISYYRKKGMAETDMDHFDCIEVRAETKKLLGERVVLILEALND